MEEVEFRIIRQLPCPLSIYCHCLQHAASVKYTWSPFVYTSLYTLNPAVMVAVLTLIPWTVGVIKTLGDSKYFEDSVGFDFRIRCVVLCSLWYDCNLKMMLKTLIGLLGVKYWSNFKWSAWSQWQNSSFRGRRLSLRYNRIFNNALSYSCTVSHRKYADLRSIVRAFHKKRS